MAHDAEHDAPDETHVSPDGLLTLIVFFGDEAWIGFDGLPWHVHGDVMDDDAARAIARIAQSILADQIVLEVRWNGDALEDAAALVDAFGHPIDDLADHRARAEKYRLPNERIELRTWSGMPAH